MQTPPQAAPANFVREVVHMMRLILWYWQNPAVTLVLAKTVKMASLEHRLKKQTYEFLGGLHIIRGEGLEFGTQSSAPASFYCIPSWDLFIKFHYDDICCFFALLSITQFLF